MKFSRGVTNNRRSGSQCECRNSWTDFLPSRPTAIVQILLITQELSTNSYDFFPRSGVSLRKNIRVWCWSKWPSGVWNFQRNFENNDYNADTLRCIECPSNLKKVLCRIVWNSRYFRLQKLANTYGLVQLYLPYLRCALAAAQCIVIGPVCLFVCLCLCVYGWGCYHDNSRLRASILTKLGL